MLRFAFCDDSIEDLKNMSTLLAEYRQERSLEFTYNSYQSSLELLRSIEKGCVYDVILLDVVMPGMNGIDTAKEIRVHDKSVKIIFLTSSSEFAVQSYVVGAYFYQLKPIWRDSFFSLMDNVIFELKRTVSESMIIRSKSGISRIQINQLIWCEVVGRTLIYHLSGGIERESIGSLRDIEQILLNYPNFIKPHRSYVVNMDYIQNILYQVIELEEGGKIPISRNKYGEIKELFLEYAFRGRKL